MTRAERGDTYTKRFSPFFRSSMENGERKAMSKRIFLWTSAAAAAETDDENVVSDSGRQ